MFFVIAIGLSTSFTITVCVADAVFPELSSTVQVIVVVPTGYSSLNRRESLRTPDGVLDIGRQLSVAIAETVTNAPH